MSPKTGLRGTAAVSESQLPRESSLIPSNLGEAIAGYTLEQRLGAGGYGEVWSAVGPGGLRKAVKIMHGRFDGPQADIEMKSLERVRELRHPFLLNIERAEIVDGRLIIVTELADQSLEDRFFQAREQGYRGIPREELLGYLRDVAVALDFMSDKHGLQHLDVKPENLLLQGEYIKVGDLGLIKDVSNSNMSLINGFTPLYAAPEIFEGRPSRSSDQYSLAIVYQAMLTGTPPFTGRTAAQLTAQHLSGAPDLSPLKTADRAAVGRALHKNPLARFPTCRDLIEELSSHRPSARRSTTPQPAPLDGAADGEKPDAKTSLIALPRLETRPLPPIAADDARCRHRPVVLVGLGGLGNRVLDALKRRLSERVGDRPLPAFPLLSIDSDPPSAHSNRDDDPHTGLQAAELLRIPLRDAKTYRRSEGLVDWLSRRWLFNIPRSRRVSGIRPLGRLALVDHHESIRQRVREAVQAATSDEAREATAAATGLALDDAPDVFIVGAISGGTGAGGVLDLAYLVRATLDELQCKPHRLHGILLHATSAVHGAADLQNANTIACLTELLHFLKPEHGYPGDPACGLTRSNVAPFDRTYVVHLGDGLGEGEIHHEAQAVAEYLYANVLGKGRPLFDAWRSTADEREAPTARTFTVATIDRSASAAAREQADALCRSAVSRWGAGKHLVGMSRRSTTEALAESIAERLTRLQISPDQLRANLQKVRNDAGRQLAAYFDGLEARIANGGEGSDSVLARLDEDFESAVGSTPGAVLHVVDEHLTAAADKAGSKLRAWLLALLDRAAGRVSTACEATSDVLARFDEVAGEWEPLLDNVADDRNELAVRLSKAGSADALGLCRTYVTSRFCEEIVQRFLNYLGRLRCAATGVATDVTVLQRRLPTLADSLQTENAAAEPPVPAEVGRFDAYLRGGTASLLTALSQENNDLDSIAAALREQALGFLLGDGEQSLEAAAMQAFEEAALARLDNLGGGRRVLAVVPATDSADGWQARLASTFGACVSVRPVERRELLLCCELEGVSLQRIIDRLTQQRPYLLETASRLHTRIDVDWDAK